MEITMNRETTSLSQPNLLLRLEGAAALAGSIALYSRFGGELLPFALLILAPDLSMLGYSVNARVGALVYNSVHTYVVPGLVLALGLLTNTPALSQIAAIWFAHISMDRMLGFGLKYPTAFKDTHFQRL
jgi:hypothetical protein